MQSRSVIRFSVFAAASALAFACGVQAKERTIDVSCNASSDYQVSLSGDAFVFENDQGRDTRVVLGGERARWRCRWGWAVDGARGWLGWSRGGWSSGGRSVDMRTINAWTGMWWWGGSWTRVPLCPSSVRFTCRMP